MRVQRTAYVIYRDECIRTSEVARACAFTTCVLRDTGATPQRRAQPLNVVTPPPCPSRRVYRDPCACRAQRGRSAATGARRPRRASPRTECPIRASARRAQPRSPPRCPRRRWSGARRWYHRRRSRRRSYLRFCLNRFKDGLINAALTLFSFVDDEESATTTTASGCVLAVSTNAARLTLPQRLHTGFSGRAYHPSVRRRCHRRRDWRTRLAGVVRPPPACPVTAHIHPKSLRSLLYAVSNYILFDASHVRCGKATSLEW